MADLIVFDLILKECMLPLAGKICTHNLLLLLQLTDQLEESESVRIVKSLIFRRPRDANFSFSVSRFTSGKAMTS